MVASPALATGFGSGSLRELGEDTVFVNDMEVIPEFATAPKCSNGQNCQSETQNQLLSISEECSGNSDCESSCCASSGDALVCQSSSACSSTRIALPLQIGIGAVAGLAIIFVGVLSMRYRAHKQQTSNTSDGSKQESIEIAS